MVGASFGSRRLAVGLAVFAAACGSGGSVEGGFVNMPWSTAAAPPPFADSAATTALASGAVPDSALLQRELKRVRAARAAPAAKETSDSAAAAPAAISARQLESTLLRLRELERRHHRQTGRYAPDPARLSLAADAGVELRVVWASPWGWAAFARDSAGSGPTCAIYLGTVPSGGSPEGRVGGVRAGTPSCVKAAEAPSRTVNQVLTLAAHPPSAQQGLIRLMRADLANLAASQRQYRAMQGVYSRTTRVLVLQHAWTPGVQLRIVSASGAGWAAETTYEGAVNKSCVAYAGEVAELPRTKQGRVPDRQGAVVCDE